MPHSQWVFRWYKCQVPEYWLFGKLQTLVAIILTLLVGFWPHGVSVLLRAAHWLVIAWPREPSVMGLVVAARHTYYVVKSFSACTKRRLGSLSRSSFIIGWKISFFLRFELRGDVIVERRRLGILFLGPGPKQVHSLRAKSRFILLAVFLEVWLCLVA